MAWTIPDWSTPHNEDVEPSWTTYNVSDEALEWDEFDPDTTWEVTLYGDGTLRATDNSGKAVRIPVAIVTALMAYRDEMDADYE